MNISQLQQRFVLHWGEMGSRWGVNRTVAQIHGLLYLLERPLTADEICETLAIARSNVSVSLRELMAWKLVRVVHVIGDRRDHFEAQRDVWDVFRTVLEERRRREIEPTLTMLRSAMLEAPTDPVDRHAQERMRSVLDFLELGTRWLDDISRLPPATQQRLLGMGTRIARWLSAPEAAAPPPDPPADVAHDVQ